MGYCAMVYCALKSWTLWIKAPDTSADEVSGALVILQGRHMLSLH